MFSIKGKTGLIILVFFILYSGISYGIQRAVIHPYFQHLEDEEAGRNLFRSLEMIYNEIDRIESICRDWASWDEAYDFVKNGTSEHIQQHLQVKTFITNHTNFIFFYDEDGNPVWGDGYDLITQERLDSLDALMAGVQAASPLLSYNPAVLVHSRSGVLIADSYPLLVSAHPLLGDGLEPQGYLVIGRFITPELVYEFEEQSEVSFSVTSLRDEAPGSQSLQIAEQISPETPRIILACPEGIQYAYTTAPDIFGEKALLISSRLSGKIIQAGRRTMLYAVVSMLIAGVFIFFGLRLILQRVILTPVSSLTRHMIRVGRTGDMAAPIPTGRRDEIGVLGKEFNDMLGKLAAKDRELVAANSKLEEDVRERQRLINELKNALSEVKTLSGLLPICAYCKKIRDDKGYWNQIETYIHQHSDARFSHGMCPDCMKRLYPEIYAEKMEKE